MRKLILELITASGTNEIGFLDLEEDNPSLDPVIEEMKRIIIPNPQPNSFFRATDELDGSRYDISLNFTEGYLAESTDGQIAATLELVAQAFEKLAQRIKEGKFA